MFNKYVEYGNFSHPPTEIVSFLSSELAFAASEKSYRQRFRRDAYDRTLTCPDLARAINDFLSSGVEFVSNDDARGHLCA